MRHNYPILIDVSQRRILIVGGGQVASRKAAGVIDAGATQVVAVAPTFTSDFPEAVQKVKRGYDVAMLDGIDLVFVATDRADVNDRVVRDAQARQVLVNRADADDENPGSFVTPAKLVDGNITITVSASAAALASRVRDAIKDRLDPRWSLMANAMQEMRPWVKTHLHLDQPQRAEIFRTLAQDDAMDVLQVGGVEALRDWLTERHPELRNG